MNEETALAEIEIHENKIDEMDLEAALNCATNALSNAAEFWIQRVSPTHSRSQQI